MYNCPHCSAPCLSLWRQLFGNRQRVITCRQCGQRARWPIRAHVLDFAIVPIAALILFGLLRTGSTSSIVLPALVLVVITRWLIDKFCPLVPETRTAAELAAPSRLTNVMLVVVIVLVLLAMGTIVLR